VARGTGSPPPRAGGRALLWALAYAVAHDLDPVATAALAACHAPAATDWPAFSRLARTHRCETIAYRLLTLPEVRAACAPPDGVIAGLRQRYSSAFVRLAMEPAFVVGTIDALAAVGVPALAVKGLAVAAWLYPDPVLREHLDVDLLAPAAAAGAVGRVLGDLGYAPAPQPPLFPGEQPATVDYRRADGGWHIDVTYDPLRLFWLPADGGAALFERWWARRQLVAVGGHELPTLGPADQFAHLARHLQFHDYFRVNSFLDLLLVLRRHGPNIDWEMVGREAADLGIAGGLHRTLELARSVYDIEAPPAAWRALRPRPAIRLLHRRIWDDALPTVQTRPAAAGRPIVPRFLSLRGPRSLSGMMLHALDRRRWRTVRYLAQRVAPPIAWLRAAYGDESTPTLAATYVVLVGRHWRAMGRVRGEIRARDDASSSPPVA
jgi:hypothetical protein